MGKYRKLKTAFEFISISLWALFILACATKPVAVDTGLQQGAWETKVLIRDFKKQKTTSLNIDFVAKLNKNLRAEITGPFGISVATLVLNEDQFQLAVHTQKKFYLGAVTDKTLNSSLGMPVDPRILYNILFDEPVIGKNFDCKNDTAGRVEVCANKNDLIKVLWTERNGYLKRVTISKPDYEVQILVKAFSTKVQENSDLFKLQVPQSYKVHQID